jgi:outer membrane receptor protein involved in Fe transport
MGQYRSDIEDEQGNNRFVMKSKINYASLAQDFVFSQLQNHEIKFGAKGIRYEINQGDLVPNENSVNVEAVNIPKEMGIEMAFYINDSWRVNDDFSINLGLRYSSFNTLGEGEVSVYQAGVPMSEESVINTISYAKGESIQKYGGFEPRLSLRYVINDVSSIKGGYNRLRQYMHLVSNTAAVTPVDLWQMSNAHVRPAISDQYTIGYFRNFSDDEIEASVEAYYKSTTDILDYKGGAKLLLNNFLESDLLQGEGRARGIEFSLKKKAGNTTGWVSYTYARTEIRAISEFPEESVNNGDYYPANYDQPHNLSLVLTQKLSKRVTFNANFLYRTGRPITIPSSVYRIGPFRAFPNFSRRNEFRIPDYHRVDVSLTFDQGFKKDRKVKSQWNFSIYNLYARKNAYSIYFTDNSRAYKLAVLGIVPSISYNFIF